MTEQLTIKTEALEPLFAAWEEPDKHRVRAVDFDWHPGKPFNHHWQDYRTRKDRSLKTVSDAGHTYPDGKGAGKHSVCVKVVDVFGCDTSISMQVDLG
jgi:hypothetical protein